MALPRDFKVSSHLTLDRNVAKKVIGIVGKRDSGKTYNGSVLAEEMVNAGIPIVVLDSMGIWWGLRVAVKYEDGKQVPDSERPGLPIVVFGGDHADIPLPMMRGQRIPLVPDPEKIRLMARSIIESGISAVIDTSGLPSLSQEMSVVIEFVRELQHANRDYGVRTIFLEEAEVWAPQSPMRDEVLCLHVMNNLVKRGGNWNLGCVLMTQRAASINKNILTQSDILMIGRLNAPQDKAAIQEWVKKAAATDETRKQLDKWYDSLNELDRGEMWVWKPDPPKIRVKTKFRLRETLHATREFLESPEVKKVKMMPVDEYVEKFRKLFEPPKPKPVPPIPSGSSVSARVIAPVPGVTVTLTGPLTGPGGPMHATQVIVPVVPVEAEVVVRKPIAGVETRKPTLQANDREPVGQLLYAVTKGEFDERQTVPKAVEILARFGWIHQRPQVEDGLLRLCDLKFFTRKISSGKMFWYTLEEDAKRRIILLETNSV